MDSSNATIVKAGGEANFNTSARQGNTNKNHYFYGGDPKVFVQNDYNTTTEYNENIVNGKKVNIVGDIDSGGSGIIDTTKTFKTIPVDITPLAVAPGTTIDDDGTVTFPQAPNVLSQIEVDKDNARRKQEEENKKKEGVYQPKKLVPLSDLSEEEIDALTDEQRKEYGLQPTVEVVGEKEEEIGVEEEKAAQIEKERLEAEELEKEKELHSKEQQLKKEAEEKKKREQRKARDKVVDKDGDGIPDTIDADAGEPAPEGQETVSTEEQGVIEEQEKESAIETVETEEIEVLDANGNIKKITVPTVTTPTTPTTVETESTTEQVIEEKPELVKPKFKDFKTSGDYMKARMKYFKSIEDEGGENTVDFDNELDDDEIKEAVDMEQNSTVIDSSKRNIFKTNGKTNIFNSILGAVDDIGKGIQQELNNITKSINNKQ